MSGIAGALGNLLAAKAPRPVGTAHDTDNESMASAAAPDGASASTRAAKAAPVMLHETEHNVSTVSYLLQVRRALLSPTPGPSYSPYQHPSLTLAGRTHTHCTR